MKSPVLDRRVLPATDAEETVIMLAIALQLRTLMDTSWMRMRMRRMRRMRMRRTMTRQFLIATENGFRDTTKRSIAPRTK
jgi:hypothetical protein